LPKFRIFALAPALALIALMAWALASPVGSSPDDDFHLASIWCANAANTSVCEPGPTATERVVPSAIRYSACYAREPKKSAACETAYLNESSKPSVITDRGSFQNNYPPVYYATMSLFAGPDIAASVVIMRLVNILLLVGITTALYLLLPVRRRSTLLWAWIVSVVPLGLFLIASNNPSSWAIIGIGSAWLALLGYLETHGKPRIALGAIFALTSVMAAGARGDAALYIVLSVGVVGILTFRVARDYFLAAILPVVVSVIAVYFFLSSQQSSVVATGLSSLAEANSGTPGSTLNLLVKNLLNVPQLWAGALGTWGLGWLDTAMPAIVSLGGIIAFVGVVFVGVTRLTPRKTIALAIVALALWALPTYVLVRGMNVVGQNVQPRYILPLMILFVGLAVFAVRSERFRLTRAQLIPMVTLLAVGESVALYMNMRRYISGSEGHEISLNTNMEWWWNIPISPMAVWMVGSLAFAALLVVLVREMSKIDAVE
jgi:hypothetical protein